MALKRITAFVLGILLTFLVINHFGLSETAAALAASRPELVAAAVILQIASLFLVVARIKILTYGKGYLTWIHAARITMTGMFVSMVTPVAKMGGEPLKMYMLRSSVNSHNASAAIALESLAEIFSSVAIVVAVLLAFFNLVPAAFVSTFLIFLAVIGIALGITLKILFTPKWLHRIITWISNRLAKAMEVQKSDYANMFMNAFYGMWKDRRILYGSIGVSVLSKFTEIVRFWLIILAVGASLPFHMVVVVWTIMLVLLFIPWLPGSLGLVEFGAAAALVAFGVPPHLAASAIVLDRLLAFWFPLVAGSISLNASRRKNELPAFMSKQDKK